MSDWMMPMQRLAYTEAKNNGVMLSGLALNLVAQADARIRELETALYEAQHGKYGTVALTEQLKTARQEALEEAAKMCERNMFKQVNAEYMARTCAEEIRALSSNEAQAKEEEPLTQECDQCGRKYTASWDAGCFNPMTGDDDCDGHIRPIPQAKGGAHGE